MIGEDKLHRAITKINTKDEIIDDEGSRQLYAGTYRHHMRFDHCAAVWKKPFGLNLVSYPPRMS